jgi:hypothetical protein
MIDGNPIQKYVRLKSSLGKSYAIFEFVHKGDVWEMGEGNRVGKSWDCFGGLARPSMPSKISIEFTSVEVDSSQSRTLLDPYVPRSSAMSLFVFYTG